MPIYHKACLPLVRLHEPCFMEKAKHRFDCPVGHMVWENSVFVLWFFFVSWFEKKKNPKITYFFRW